MKKAGTIVLNRGEGTQNPQIKGGTVEKLVERLTYEKYPDPEYLQAFLLTYRSFTTATEVLEMLIKRYSLEPPNKEDVERFNENTLKPIRLRVYNVLKNWLERHYHDFEEDQNLGTILSNFIEKNMMQSNMSKLGEALKRTLERKAQGEGPTKSEPQRRFTQPAPKPILPKNLQSFTFNDLHAQEVARQLTLIEFDLFKAIQPKELLNQCWNKKNKQELAPNVVSMIKRFNDVSSWVTTEILKQADNLKNRTTMIEKFIQIAQQFLELNNFNGVMEVLAGLQSAAVHRLKKTWAGVKKKSNEKFDEFKTLMSNRGSYKNFRHMLHNVDPPCIPYLGVYLTDLTFIEDGNPNTLNESGLVNFSKRRKIASVIRDIQQFQQTHYSLEVVAPLRDFSLSLEIMSEDEAYEASLKCEARQPQGA